MKCVLLVVLNLIITGIPSIPKENVKVEEIFDEVLNLIITGIPSILSWQRTAKS